MKIKNELEYERALIEIEKLIDKDPLKGTKEGIKLEKLCLLVNEYEDKYYLRNN